MENLRKRVLVLGTDLLMDTKKRVKALKVQATQQLDALESTWQKKMETKLASIRKAYDLEVEHLEGKSAADIQLKEQLILLEVKNQLMEDMKECLLGHIRTQITENYEEYIDYLSSEITASATKINQDAILSVNERDYAYFTQNGTPSTPFNITLSESPIEAIGGFELETPDHGKIVKFSLESMLNKQDIIIANKVNELIKSEE